MSEGRIAGIRWRLDEDGGGEAFVFIDYRSHVDERKYVFDSLEELPRPVAEAIRKDGRIEGEIQ